MTTKYTPEVKQILKAAGFTPEQIKTSEVRATQELKAAMARSEEPGEPLNPEKFTENGLLPIASHQDH